MGADAERLDHADRVAGAGDDLGRAAADVDHQPPLAGAPGPERARDAHVDQAPFFLARDHLDRIADRLLEARKQLLGVARHAQRVGGDHAHRVQPVLAQDGGEVAQAAHRGVRRLDAQHIVRPEAGRQADRVARGAHDVDLAGDRFADVETEAVGAEVDCCVHGCADKIGKSSGPV